MKLKYSKLFSFLIIFFSSLSMESCSKSVGSSFKHLTGDNRSDASKLFWVSLKNEDIETQLKLKDVGAALPPRFESLLSDVRQKIGDLGSKIHMEHVPNPSFFVLDESYVNAYVESLDVCYGLALVNTLAIREGAKFQTNFNSTRLFKDSSPKGTDIGCNETNIKGDLSSESAHEIYRIFQIKYPECSFELAVNEYAIIYQCPVGYPLQWSSQNIVVNATIDRIFLTTELLKRSEQLEDLFPVVGHELAHYFMAHNQETLNVLISDRDDNRRLGGFKEEPLDDAYLLDLKKSLLSQVVPKHKKAAFEPEVFIFLRLFLAQIERAYGSQEPNMDSPKIDLSSPEITALKSFLKELEIDLSSYEKLPSAASEKTSAMILNLQSDIPYPKELIKTVEILLMTRFSNLFDKNEVPDVVGFLNGSNNSLVFFQILNNFFETKKLKIQKTVESVIDKKLYFYNHELEADEVMLEYLKILSLDEKMAVKSFLKNLMDSEDESDQCRNILLAQNIDREFYRLPKNFFAEHLDPCFRVINLQKEILRHQNK